MSCRFHGSAKGCRYGNNCQYSHDNPQYVPLCRNISLSNGCRYGIQCNFRHQNYQRYAIDSYLNPLWNIQSQKICSKCYAINNVGFICCNSCFIRKDITTEPWQITLILTPLFKMFATAINCSCKEVDLAEKEVLEEMISINKIMANLRAKLDVILNGDNEVDEQEKEEMRRRFYCIQGQLFKIQTKEAQVNERYNELYELDTVNRRLLEDYQMRIMKCSMNKALAIETDSDSDYYYFKNCRDELECLVFGYIHETMDDDGLLIPNDITFICFVYVGYIIMDSNILNVNQINKIGFVSKMLWEEVYGNNYFYPKKIFDAKVNGYDQQSFDKICNDYKNIICVVNTNYNHILVSFYTDLYMKNRRIYSFLLQSNYVCSPYMNLKEYDIDSGTNANLCADFNLDYLNINTSLNDIKLEFPKNERLKEYDDLQAIQYEVFHL